MTSQGHTACGNLHMRLKAGSDLQVPQSRFVARECRKCRLCRVPALHRCTHPINVLQDGTTALHLAAYSGKTEAVELLIRTGASVHAQNCDGQTPLFEAAAAGHLEVAKVLLNHGADAGGCPSASTPSTCLVSFSLLFPDIMMRSKMRGIGETRPQLNT